MDLLNAGFPKNEGITLFSQIGSRSSPFSGVLSPLLVSAGVDEDFVYARPECKKATRLSQATHLRCFPGAVLGNGAHRILIHKLISFQVLFPRANPFAVK